ncbi:hypothetical protein ACIOTI_18375 [Streptomyces sp. NPDC087843]|uniref:hypothetical protein n=1 Tax=Streptomyces sp. NPDC087843 TaxID=3365804 RepID=UPI00382ABCA8
MHDASRTGRRVTGDRRPMARTVLVAVLLALFTAFAVGAPPAGRADRAGGDAASAGLHALMTAPDHRPGPNAADHPPGPDAADHRPGTTVAAPAHFPDTTDHRPGVVPPAHEECAAVCSTRAGGRHALDGERPAPPVHLVTTADATAVRPVALVRTPRLSGPAPHSAAPAVRDRGRAPPASSGT